MLSALTLKQIEAITSNLPKIIKSSFDAYESINGKFSVSVQRKTYEDIYYDFFSSIIKRIEREDAITILPLYDKLACMLVNLQFNVRLFVELTSIVEKAILELTINSNTRNSQLEQFVETYIDKVISAVTEERIFQKGLEADQLIQLVQEYAPSSVVIEDTFRSTDIDHRTIYPLFDRNNYWEVQKENYENFGRDKYSTREVTIYQGKVYTLNQNVSKPTTKEFSLDEWGEFNSKFLLKSNTFKEKLKSNLKTYINSSLENVEDINGIISDSKIQEKNSVITYDKEDLKLTLAGEGVSITENILKLKTLVKYFGNHEASPIGNIDYISKYCEYLYGSLYGRIIGNGFTSLDGFNLLGKFNLLFSYGEKINRIAGLKFLESFKSLKSFKQRITLPETITLTSTDKKIYSKAKYNPIYAKYYNGIEDRFFFQEINPYVEAIDVDIILFGIERLLNVANRLGDTINALKSGLNQQGILPGYEGLGPISIQVEELSNIFISTTELEESYANSKILPGFNGAMAGLLRSYGRLSDVLITPPFTGSALARLSLWGRKIQGVLERIVSDISNINYAPGDFIPNISFKKSTLEREKLIDQLRSLNFQESEIDLFLSAETFEELLIKFAPITDAADQLSFFRGYELSQLIYEFGGESAIDAYISYLYDFSESNLINLLTFATKDKTSGVTFNENRYGKLVGLLINLTFAINPDQLILFKDYLAGNDLDLFESITYLLKNKEVNLLLDKDSIDLLRPITESLISGASPFGYNSRSMGYAEINREVPLAVKKWTELIGKNLGNASTNLIQNLYDKSQGLTPRELITILNTGSEHNHNDYGQLIDGYEGGRLTKLINYGYLSGLLHKLGYYSNSYQINNFYISGSGPIRLDSLVGVVKSLVSLTDITLTNFTNSIEYDLSQDSVDLYPFENLFNTQNKKIEEVSKLVKGLSPSNGDISTIGLPTVSGFSDIMGSPGIGNSPVPESIPRENTITPEQANLLSPQIKNCFSFIANKTSEDERSNEVTNRFISFIEENKLIVGVSAKETIVEANSNTLKAIDKIKDFKAPKALEDKDRNADVKIPSFYERSRLQDKVNQEEIDSLQSQGLLTKFDPVSSCKRFGGENCDSRIESGVNLCGDINNRSTYSQRDTTPSQVSQPGSIGVDRPFGSFAELKPEELFLPYSQNNKPPYFALLGNDVKISNNGNPIKPSIDTEPLVFTKEPNVDDSLYSSYYNSEYGLIEAIKAKWEKDEPFKCSLLEDPYAYQACMNLLKCKRFKRGEGTSFLKFCPKTLSGGLLK